MSDVLNYKEHLSPASQNHYISQTTIAELIKHVPDPLYSPPDEVQSYWHIRSTAHTMVSERHNKSDLVHMTFYLLSTIHKLRTELEGYKNQSNPQPSPKVDGKPE